MICECDMEDKQPETVLLWEFDDKHFSDLECSLTGAAKSEEIFQEKGGRDFPGVKLEVMKPRHGLIL